jgi:hypothetical protein
MRFDEARPLNKGSDVRKSVLLPGYQSNRWAHFGTTKRKASDKKPAKPRVSTVL